MQRASIFLLGGVLGGLAMILPAVAQTVPAPRGGQPSPVAPTQVPVARPGAPAKVAVPVQAGAVTAAGRTPSAAATSGSTPAAAGAANSAGLASQYTMLELKRCKRAAAAAQSDGGRWQCSGPKGYEVVFAEGDLRQFLGYGAKAREQKAMTQTLGPFNSIFKNDSDRATLQWRGRMEGGKFVPFATIVRYHIDTGDDGSAKRQRSQVLVVTKLGAADGGEACHVAYIDALANKDANTLAARTADEMVRGFDCTRPPAIVGNKGTVPPVPSARI